MKDQIVNRIKNSKVIAVVDDIYGMPCVMLAKALRSGGIELLELVLNENNHSQVWNTVQLLHQELGSSVSVGIGNISFSHEVRIAKDSGAEFVSSYITDTEIIRTANNLNLVVIPGALTPTEIVTAHRSGADFVKVYPTACMGPAYFKEIYPVIKNVPVLAHGGITRPNVRLYEHAGVMGVFVDNCLFTKELVQQGDWHQITNTAKTFVGTL